MSRVICGNVKSVNRSQKLKRVIPVLPSVPSLGRALVGKLWKHFWNWFPVLVTRKKLGLELIETCSCTHTVE